jgi:hypothetical protein
MLSYSVRDTGKSVSRQIDKSVVVFERKKVHQLCPAGRLARPGELAPVDDYVDGARLSGIGSARDCDLPAFGMNLASGYCDMGYGPERLCIIRGRLN